MKNKENRGITLIALIITIIVLLILAGISINAITGSENAMIKAKEAREKNEAGEIYDMLTLGWNNIKLEQGLNQDDICEYYKNKELFIKNNRIDTNAYQVDNYKCANYIASGVITNKNLNKYRFQINLELSTIKVEKLDGDYEEELPETPATYFNYVTSSNKKCINGLSEAGEEAYSKGELVNLVIPKKTSDENDIKIISRDAFKNKDKIEKILIHDNIEKIEKGAFEGCSGLEELTMPINITPSGDTGGTRFSDCSKLRKVKLTPGSGNNIGRGVDYGKYYGDLFYDLTPWKIASDAGQTQIDVIIAEGVTSIGNYTFFNCPAIKSLSMPSTLTEVREYAFQNCSGITKLNFPANITTIGRSAFDGCSGVEGTFILPANVTTINNRTFAGMNKVTKIVIHDNIVKMENEAFSGCASLKELTMPINITSSGDTGGSRFAGCTKLEKVSLTKGCGNNLGIGVDYGQYYGNLFYDLTPWKIASDGGQTQIEVTIEDGVTTIGKYTFINCANVKVINLPSSLVEIKDYAFSNITTPPTNIYYGGTSEQWSSVTKNNNSITISNK